MEFLCNILHKLKKDNDPTNEFQEIYPKLIGMLPKLQETQECVINKLKTIGHNPDDLIILYILKKGFVNNVQELDSNKDVKIKNDTVKYLACLPKLKDLTIYKIDDDYLDFNIFEEIFKLDLTHLCLARLDIRDEVVEALGRLSNGQLQNLNLTECNVTKVSGGLDKLQNLTHLFFYDNEWDTLEGIEK